MIHDNILIAHELMHYLQSSRNNTNKVFVIKLEIIKAYDLVEWDFLERVMLQMGFPNSWVTKVMRCVHSVRYVIKCNSTLIEVVIPKRGVHQGDPPSPTFFCFVWRLFPICFTRLKPRIRYGALELVEITLELITFSSLMMPFYL